MKAITWLAVFAAPAILSQAASANTLAGWSTDLTKALSDAKAQNKNVLVEFTGSDWCPPCIAMRKNVFSQKDFVKKASENFVLVELDFPRKNKETVAKNKPHATKYQVDAFPTVVLLGPDGKEFSRFIASEYPDKEAFLKHLESALAQRKK